MKPKFLILVLVFAVFTVNSYSQNLYQMNEGETISVDENGHLINTGIPKTTISKVNMPVTTSTIEKNSIYTDNGRLKIPGYVPSENFADDEESYNNAKRMLYIKNPEEFDKWFGNKNTPSEKIIVRSEEFQKMPDIKKQQILANPDKYYIEDVNINPDCNHK